VPKKWLRSYFCRFYFGTVADLRDAGPGEQGSGSPSAPGTGTMLCKEVWKYQLAFSALRFQIIEELHAANLHGGSSN